MKKTKKLLLCLAATLLFISLPAISMAQEATKYREEIRDFQTRIDQIKKNDVSKYQSEISQIENWINEALVKIGREDYNATKNLNLKTSVYINYVEASQKREKVKAEEKEIMEKLTNLRTEKGTLEAAVQQLSAQEQKLLKSTKSN